MSENSEPALMWLLVGEPALMWLLVGKPALMQLLVGEPPLMWLFVDLLFEMLLTNMHKKCLLKIKNNAEELRTMSNSLTPWMELFICENNH